MKYRFNFSVLSVLFLMLGLAACNQDMENAVYTNSTAGISFSSETSASKLVSPLDATFTVDLYREKADEAINGEVKLFAYILDAKKNKIEQPGYTVSNYSFKENEFHTSVTVSAEPLEIGGLVYIDLSVNKDDSALGGTFQTTITVSKDYTWESKGNGYFADNGLFNWYNNKKDEDPNLVNRLIVEIFEAKEDPGRYRIANPYAEYLKATWPAEDMTGFSKDKGDDYFVFKVFPNNKVYYGLSIKQPYKIGVKHVAKNLPIQLEHPFSFGLDESNNIKVDDKHISIAPMYYMDGAGGFNMTAFSDIIVITLP